MTGTHSPVGSPQSGAKKHRVSMWPRSPKHTVCGKENGSQQAHAGMTVVLGHVEPTGHPPTASEMVIPFSGSLEKLLKACVEADQGTIFDLAGAVIGSEGSSSQVSRIPPPSSGPLLARFP